jgi:tRNA (adenine37-N6)-methyltransferase
MRTLTVEPIGIIHSEHDDPRQTPIQSVCAEGCPGRVEVFPEYSEGLDDIEGFSHLHLIYWFHRLSDLQMRGTAAAGDGEQTAGPKRGPLKVVPFLDDVPRGVFAVRAPVRPNPIGLSVVRLVERRGGELIVEDVDVLDGTPLLDIKPYVEGFDLRLGTRGGWTERVDRDTFVARGTRRPQQG